MNQPPVFPENRTLLGNYAGFATRLMAFILDSLVVSSSLFFITWFINSTLFMLQAQAIAQRFSNLFPWLNIIEIMDFLNSATMVGIYSFSLIIAYYILLWTFTGQTIGKAIMGIKIVPNQGGKMTLGRSILRYVGYFISAFAFGLGFLWILVDDRRFAWHDRLARTSVVYSWDARPDESFLTKATNQILSPQNPLKKTNE